MAFYKIKYFKTQIIKLEKMIYANIAHINIVSFIINYMITFIINSKYS